MFEISSDEAQYPFFGTRYSKLSSENANALTLKWVGVFVLDALEATECPVCPPVNRFINDDGKAEHFMLSNSVPWAHSMRFPFILVGRTGRGNVAGDLRPAGMRPGQCSGEGDAGAGDLCTGRVRTSERRGDGDCGAARLCRLPPMEATTAVS